MGFHANTHLDMVVHPDHNPSEIIDHELKCMIFVLRGRAIHLCETNRENQINQRRIRMTLHYRRPIKDPLLMRPVACLRNPASKGPRLLNPNVSLNNQTSLSPIPSPLRLSMDSILYHAKTLYLFTRSDNMTTMIPIVRFVVDHDVSSSLIYTASSSLSSGWCQRLSAQSATFHISSCGSGFIFSISRCRTRRWTSRKTRSISRVSTPSRGLLIIDTVDQDRPLPAGRISLRNAVILRWALMPTCWALSLAYSKEVMYASMTLCAFTTMYNELHGAWSIFSRYALNGVGFAAFEAGTTLVASA